jgi:hypothetical protein
MRPRRRCQNGHGLRRVGKSYCFGSRKNAIPTANSAAAIKKIKVDATSSSSPILPNRKIDQGMLGDATDTNLTRTVNSALHRFDNQLSHQSTLATVTIATAIEINSIVKFPIVQSPD